MDNDYSWLGLFKKGYKLQVKIYKIGWQTFNDIDLLKVAMQLNYPIRYKHSIQ